MVEATYLASSEKHVQYVSEASMAVLQIATLSSGSAILYFHSQLLRLLLRARRKDLSQKSTCFRFRALNCDR